MEKKELLTKLLNKSQETFSCLERLQNSDEEKLPAIEIALLEQKLIAFYDEVQKLKRMEQGIDARALNKARQEFASLKSQLSKTETDAQKSTEVEIEKAEASTEKSSGEETIIDIGKIEDGTDKEYDEEVNALFEEAESQMSEPTANAIVEEKDKSERKAETEMPVSGDQATPPKKKSEKSKVSEAKQKAQEKTPEINNEGDLKKDQKAPEPEGEKDEEKASKPSSVHEKYGERKKSLLDKLASKKEGQNPLGSQLSGKPIKDLKKAINLNTQVRFTKELFDGDKRGFKKAIDFINKCKTYSEARSYVQVELVPAYEWTEDKKVYQDFMNLVKRKFV